MSDYVVLVSEEQGFGSLRFWAVEGDADTAEKIEEITNCATSLVPVLSFDSFLSQIGKHNAFRRTGDGHE